MENRVSNSKEKELRKKVLEATAEYYLEVHGQSRAFSKGDRIAYGGRVFDEQDMLNLVDSSLDFWLTAGRYARRFESEFAAYVGTKHASLTNSGSSANLLAFSALTSPSLGDRRIDRGDEVITVAAGFPTTVTPIIQYGAIPVFLDISLPSYNMDASQLEEALSDRTRAVMIAHTLGNPFDVQKVKSFCEKHDLWLIEDNCDALGSRVKLDGRWHQTGTFGHLGTSSFYPPHHMTMGEGGAVVTNETRLKKLVESFRDWGRDCWCASGRDNTCGRRFEGEFGLLPAGYDHKFVYSHFGYNLKVTEMQAAIGCAQLEKLPAFVKARKENWQTMRDGLADLADKFILPEPSTGSDPSWFGFLLTVRPESGLKRDDLVAQLESSGIQTRMLFAGNLLSHPCFDEMRENGQGFRVVGNLENTDRVMRDSFWLGVYPGLDNNMLNHTLDVLRQAAKG
jgi:CDP-4-dehydro-6-deoxyglucose reductase, E1